MFSKKGKTDALEVAKVALKIAARHLLASKPDAALAIAAICAFQQENDMSGVAVDVMAKNTDLFSKDPLLKNDVEDLMGLIGLNLPDVDVPKAHALMAVLCSMV